jgi:hypothetical protein
MDAPSLARVAGGSTSPNDWKVYTESCVVVDVDTSAGQFKGTPVYSTSIGGQEEHWLAIGVTAIYPRPDAPFAQGFRVYVRRRDGQPLPLDDVKKKKGWFINWIGVDR